MVHTPQIELANIGMADTLILMVLALVVFGPRRLPQIGRQIGKLMYEFRKASNDFKFQMEEELRLAEDADRRKQQEAERQKAALAAPATVEAQADVGAVEPPAEAPAAGHASPYPGEETYPPHTSDVQVAETNPIAVPQQVVIPRVGPVIQPPSTGEPIPAVRNGAGRAVPEATAEAGVGAEANIGTVPVEAKTTNPTETEPTTQHG